MSIMMEGLDSATRSRLEDIIGNLIPIRHGEEYFTLLGRARKEEHLEMLISQCSQNEQDGLELLVMKALDLYRYKTRAASDVPSFERRVQAASTRRGWASIRWQADDPTLDHFDVELISREIHVGWARALTQVRGLLVPGGARDEPSAPHGLQRRLHGHRHSPVSVPCVHR